MNGIIRFPKEVSPDAQDLIEWLLAKNPEDRPVEFSDVKKHVFFKNIHWGRFAKKQAIPPWIPDLYSWHAPKRFTNVPLNHVFHKVKTPTKLDSVSYNSRVSPNSDLQKSLYTFDSKSNRVLRKKQKHPEQEFDYEAEVPNNYLEGFDSNIESKEEASIRKQLESYYNKKDKSSLKIKGKSDKTK